MKTSFLPLIAAVLFSIGALGFLIRRNVIVILMCVELMLNAVNLTFAAYAYELRSMTGHIFIFFIMTVAAAEAAVGLAIVIALFRKRQSTDVDDVDLMRW
ncbi:MAG TPA: NADH-quinone oxidoreductase subunit NuoK [Candidatus Polarisedimenticolia bacterium]|nr:NADH-quinone oxidoreductase subunit NuoK [Candidatus Polarisedimenticolia bacterium]